MKLTKILTILALAIIGVMSDVGGCTIPPGQATHNSVSKISVMESKKCTKCGEVKLFSEFYKRASTLDGLTYYCKVCATKEDLEYKRSKNGIISVIYNSQVSSSKKRNHPTPTYSKEQLKDWCLKQESFHELYDNWVVSGYDRWLKPSCDRTDDYQGYSLRRLRITTWGENKSKGENDRRSGIDNRSHKAVTSINIKTGVKKEYSSASIAARELGLYQTNISKCCLGNTGRITSGGYKWEFKSEAQ